MTVCQWISAVPEPLPQGCCVDSRIDVAEVGPYPHQSCMGAADCRIRIHFEIIKLIRSKGLLSAKSRHLKDWACLHGRDFHRRVKTGLPSREFEQIDGFVWQYRRTRGQ